MKNRFLSLFLVSTLFLPISGFGQEDSESKEKPKPAYVRIVNLVTPVPGEAWKSGVDLQFKDRKLAVDLRSGETASYNQLYFTGKDELKVFQTGSENVLDRVPTKFKKDEFYSVYLTGSLVSKPLQVSAQVVRNFPLPKEKTRKGMARISVFNAIEGFPVSMRFDENAFQPVKALEFIDHFVAPGTRPYTLQYPRSKKERELLGRLILTSDHDYTLVFYTAGKKGDRPGIRLTDNTRAKADILEQLATIKADEEAKKKGKDQAATE